MTMVQCSESELFIICWTTILLGISLVLYSAVFAAPDIWSYNGWNMMCSAFADLSSYV